MATKRKRKPKWLRVLNSRPEILRKKLGILGTRAGATAAIALVAGIIETAWLRWFVAASILCGALLALLFHLLAREPGESSILKPKL